MEQVLTKLRIMENIDRDDVDLPGVDDDMQRVGSLVEEVGMSLAYVQRLLAAQFPGDFRVNDPIFDEPAARKWHERSFQRRRNNTPVLVLSISFTCLHLKQVKIPETKEYLKRGIVQTV